MTLSRDHVLYHRLILDGAMNRIQFGAGRDENEVFCYHYD